MPRLLHLVLFTVFFSFQLIFPKGAFAAQPLILLNGTWAIDNSRDPFLQRFPAVSYLPAGTIVFETAPAPLGEGYFSALTQNGFWLQIAKPSKGGPMTAPLSSFAVSVPSNSLFVHRSIFCLSDTNRIVEPQQLCESGQIKTPVGEGWLFKFHDSEKAGWIVLEATIDQRTREQLEDRGWDQLEAVFDVKSNDLDDLESKGYITLLNRSYPIKSFDNQKVSPVFMKCGTKTLTQRELSAAVSADAGLEAKASFFGWLTSKIGIEINSSAEASRKYTVEIDTTNQSYLYYSIASRDHIRDVNQMINIEKTFECKAGPQNEFGERMISVSIEIDQPGAPDPIIYEFEQPVNYAPTPESIYGFSSRPLFVSLNSPDMFAAAVDAIMNKWGIEDRRDAEFIAANINYSCPSRTRSKCSDLVSNQ